MRTSNRIHVGIDKRIVTAIELALASLYFRPSSTGDVNYDQTHPPIDSRNRNLSQMRSRARLLARLIKV